MGDMSEPFWSVIYYLRDLYETTDYSLEYLSQCVKRRFDFDIDPKQVSKIVRNKRWRDENYIPIKRNRGKVTEEIKRFIMESQMSPTQLTREIKERFKVEISVTRVRQLKQPIRGEVSLVI